MHDRVVLVLAHQVFLTLDQQPGVCAHPGALASPGRDPFRAVQARQGQAEVAQRPAQLALRRDVERVVAAHEHRVRSDLHDAGLGDAAVHALAPDQEE